MFMVGSALCGAAKNMAMLIAGRCECQCPYRSPSSQTPLAVQGVGAGGIEALTAIIMGDLVSLQDRGTFNGILAA